MATQVTFVFGPIRADVTTVRLEDRGFKIFVRHHGVGVVGRSDGFDDVECYKVPLLLGMTVGYQVRKGGRGRKAGRGG